jgi:hypothetical protein
MNRSNSNSRALAINKAINERLDRVHGWISVYVVIYVHIYGLPGDGLGSYALITTLASTSNFRI